MKLYSGDINKHIIYTAYPPTYTGWEYIKLQDKYWVNEEVPGLLRFGKVEQERCGPLPFYIKPSRLEPIAPWYEWFAVNIDGLWIAVDKTKYEQISWGEYNELGKRLSKARRID